MEDIDVPKNGSPKRNLGLFTSIMLVIGLLIGSGIYKKIVPMAQTGLGEWEILAAWAAAGVITLMGALTIAGLATITEKSGGSYEYFRLAFGNFISFLSCWTEFTVVGSGAIAALSFLFAQALGSIIDIPNPFESIAHLSIGNFIFPFAHSGVKMLGVISLTILTIINLVSATEGAMFNNIITVAKILGVIVLIALGVSYTGADQSVIRYDSENAAVISDNFSFNAFFAAMLGAFWAYDGWVAAANVSGEIKNPKRNVALAIIFGVLITMVAYLSLNFAFLNVLSVETIRSIGENEIGALVVAKAILGNIGVQLVLVLIVISVFGALNSSIIAYPRKYFRMAEEDYFFKSAAKVHPKFKTPHIALIYSGAWGAVLLISGSFEMLTDMVIFTAFIFYGLLAVALIKLKRNGTIKSRVIGYPLIPLLFLIFAISLSINTILVQPKLSLMGISLILSGIPFYYHFKNKNAKTRTELIL